MTQKFYVVDDQHEASKKAVESYVTGFILSIVFTVIAYFVVVSNIPHKKIAAVIVVVLGVAQLLAQVFFFLHLPAKSKPYWNLIVFFFTLLIVAFLVIGSLWIMYNLNYNMMGVSPFNSNEGYVPQ